MFLPPLPHESNRLRVLINDSQGIFQHYIYDASGERVLKANSNYTALYENGSLLSQSTTTLNKYTIYPSPFVVLNSEDVLSKHYYVGTQRVASRLRNDIRFDCSNCSTTKKSNSNLKSTEDNSLKQAQIDDLQMYMDLAGKGKVNFAEAPQTEIAETTATSRQAQTTTAGVEGLYYYHPDHLGTSTFLTDQNGIPYQFFLNLPFGETMAEQKGSGYYQNAYKFNGKEQDEETGLYYYGARYYNPKTSIWLSVDPLAEQGPEYSPYCYTFNNPINLTDPDGRWPELPSLHTALDVAGLVPGLGEIADGVNAVIYLAEGNKLDAALSVAAMVPLAGTVATVAKFARKADKANDSRKVLKNAEAIAEGKKFEADELAKSVSEGKNVSGRNRLVPQNGKGNVKGNRTDTDQLIKNDDGTFSIKETKRSSSTRLSKGQSESQKHVKSGDGVFEVRTNRPSQGLKKGDEIQVKEYIRKNKND